MTYRIFVPTVAIGTLLAWAALAILVNNSVPESGPEMIVLFYGSLGLALFGTITLLGLALRFIMRRPSIDTTSATNGAARHGLLAAVLCVIILNLLAADIFTWWTVVLLVFIAILIELVVWVRARRTA